MASPGAGVSEGEAFEPVGLRGLSVGWQSVLGVAFVAFLAHAWHYTFLTDDAYISFHYAQNLSDGAGLVFNPGERVEGYTNFLWVLVLAAFDSVGLRPHRVALPLSFVATAAFWAVAVAFAARQAPPGRAGFAAAFVGIGLALTPSVAVWSTSGLETRLFELLVLSGMVRLVFEDRRLSAGETPWPLGSLLLGLGCLTRPDSLLIAACTLTLASLWRPREWRERLPWITTSALVIGLLVGGHFAFRIAYYGDWLPNTYYAKVEGARLWGIGARYLAAFVIEYGAWLWVPWLLAGVFVHRRRGSGLVPALFGAACIPHLVYFVSVGGDHFEYRPLDLYFPFAFILMAHGAAHVLDTRRRLPAAALLAASIPLCFEFPYRAHIEFPEHYSAGFPAAYEFDDAAADYLNPDRALLYGLPGLSRLALWHRDLVRKNAHHFGAIRRDEHAGFVRTVEGEGYWLRRMVEQGKLPHDTRLAICCVGAVPYYSRLPVLDRLGLTDATVAKGPTEWPDMLAHRKKATRAYARERGVDLWSVDPVHMVFNGRDPNLDKALLLLLEEDRNIFFAEALPDRYLLVELIQGAVHARTKFPNLRFRSVRNEKAVHEAVRRLRARRKQLRGMPPNDAPRPR
jgi:hypothetical protein